MKASAICPTYNRRQYIPSMIGCFLSQTCIDSELIIADDGTDSISDLIPANPRIKYLRFEKRLTVGEKRNLCCEQAQGEFIVHFDDDDWSAPGRIADQIATLERTNRQVLTYFNFLYQNVDTNKTYCYHPSYRGTPYGASFCYRKDWWAQHKFSDVNIGEDTGFGGAARDASQLIGSDAKQLMVVRAHDSNTCVVAQFQGTTDIPLVDSRELPAGLRVPKLLVGIKTCFQPTYVDPQDSTAIDWRDRQRCFVSEKRRTAIRTTWLTGFDGLGIDHKFFFGHPPSTDIQPLRDEVFLDCGDKYYDIADKFKAVCQWTLDHGYDYLLLTDDDVFIYPDRLLKTDWANFGYSGAACCDFLIGCCTFFSRPAMEKFNSPILHRMDDAWAGMLMRANGIAPHILPNMHCFLGDKYNVDPAKIPVDHDWSVFHVCSPEVMKTFWDRRTSDRSGLTAVINPAPVPRIIVPVARPKVKSSNQCEVDWWDTPAGQRMARGEM